MTNKISSKLLEFLVCPITSEALVVSKDEQYLVAQKSGHKYRINNGIPELIKELVSSETQI